ncbi:N-acetylmuramic acid 6-phosphate etherase [Lacticaseibacillus saniviri]
MTMITEQRNPATMTIDQQSTLDILRTINQEDRKVPEAVGQPETLATMAQIVDYMVASYQSGNRVFYIGAGTSGRLGVLDAVELVPTYGISGTEVIGLQAGGQQAMYTAVEGAEDSKELAITDLKHHDLHAGDLVIGIAASGRTPYVIGGLDYANSLGLHTAAISCNPDAAISAHAELAIEVVVGPEVVTGSTRMKAGTAQKLVLNMMSTAMMIRAGKVYGNLMVDLKPTNQKLEQRAQRIVQEATGASVEAVADAYERANHSVKTAIVMLTTNGSVDQANAALAQHDGRVAPAIAQLVKEM